MSISKSIQRPAAFAARGNDFKIYAVKDGIFTSVAVVAVVIVISLVVWISSVRDAGTDSSDSINVNIIHEQSPASSSETAEEYIEYEMPDISF